MGQFDETRQAGLCASQQITRIRRVVNAKDETDPGLAALMALNRPGSVGTLATHVQ